MCGHLGGPHAGLCGNGIEVCIVPDAVGGLEGLWKLVEHHSPAVVVLSRASLDLLFSDRRTANKRFHAAKGVENTLQMLSPVNAELVRLVAKGLRNTEIGRATGMKPRTVRARLSELYRQFEVTNRTELVGVLIELDRQIDPEPMVRRDSSNSPEAQAAVPYEASRLSGTKPLVLASL